MKKIFAFSLLALLCLSACGDHPKTSADEPATAALPQGETFFLKGSDNKIVLPKGFRESGRNRLVNDLPLLKQDSFMLQSMQRFLDRLEFKDADLDFFVDTSAVLHFLVITEMGERVPLDKDSGSMAASMLRKLNEYEELASGGKIKFEKMETNFKRGRAGEYFKFKYRVEQEAHQVVYKIVYMLTTGDKSFFLVEFVNDPIDLESSVANLQ